MHNSVASVKTGPIFGMAISVHVHSNTIISLSRVMLALHLLPSLSTLWWRCVESLKRMALTSPSPSQWGPLHHAPSRRCLGEMPQLRPVCCAYGGYGCWRPYCVNRQSRGWQKCPTGVTDQWEHKSFWKPPPNTFSPRARNIRRKVNAACHWWTQAGEAFSYFVDTQVLNLEA